jgi:hypothetical protein
MTELKLSSAPNASTPKMDSVDNPRKIQSKNVRISSTLLIDERIPRRITPFDKFFNPLLAHMYISLKRFYQINSQPVVFVHEIHAAEVHADHVPSSAHFRLFV